MDDAELLTQKGRAIAGLARHLLASRCGERLPRVADLARTINVGHGTIQDALAYLQSAGALGLTTHGAQGTDIVDLKYGRLWEAAGNEWVTGSMPLPYTRRYEGLATALAHQLEESVIPFNLSYLRGSIQRANMVRTGKHHFAVMSSLAAHHMVEHHPALSIAVVFPEGSYVSEHVLISRTPIEQVGRIGIDESSLDEVLLTQEECRLHGLEPRVMPIRSGHVIDLLEENAFDAIVWNRDGVREPLANAVIHPLKGSMDMRRLASRAALLVRKDAAIVSLVKEIITRDRTWEIQQEVLAGRVLPRY